MSLLVARGLSVGMPGIPVLRDVSFALEPGRVLGLVGESGAGKSMIGRTVSGLLPSGFAVTAGALEFGGRDLLALSPGSRRALLGREIAFVPQEPLTALNPVLTIGTQFREHLSHLGVTRSEQHARAVAALDSVHLPDAAALLGRYPHQLSGGMCQRVLIAMAFAGNPRLVVADEPTTALDVGIQARIMALMAELQRAHNTAVLFITHDLHLAARICDEVAVLYAGGMAERGPAADVLRRPLHPYTRCLQLATPSLHHVRPLFVLPDQMPGLRAMATATGCRFAPRCPVAGEECRVQEPSLPDSPHAAACWHSARVAEIAEAKSPLALREGVEFTRLGESRFFPPPLEGGAGGGVTPLRKQVWGTTTSRNTARLPTPPLTPPSRGGEKPQTPLLHITALTKTFHRTHALRPSSFTIAPGAFVAVVGESGSGKSTLGRLVVGLETPTAGTIHLAGQDVTGRNETARRHRLAHVQMVFQDPQSALNPRRTVGSIVTQALEAQGASVAERTARATALLAEMGLPPEAAHRTPAQLSGGQRQRVNIARALCCLPSLLVADEIVSGLDVSVQAQLLGLLSRLRAQHGFALLFISHDLAVVRHLCERVLVMHQGEIVEQGDTEAVFAAPAHPYTRALLAASAG